MDQKQERTFSLSDRETERGCARGELERDRERGGGGGKIERKGEREREKEKGR